MKIFPAIDIKDKKCVRLVKGDFDNHQFDVTITYDIIGADALPQQLNFALQPTR